MQQKTSFKLDRISADDKFSPKTLNDNATQVESALNTMSTMMVAGDAQLSTDLSALDARVTALEVHKIVAGTYVGNGSNRGDAQIISLGFTPCVVFLAEGAQPLMTTTEKRFAVELIEGGFKVSSNESSGWNGIGRLYYYLALA